MKIRSSVEKNRPLLESEDNGLSLTAIPAPIVYTQTRTVNVTPAVFKEHRVVAALGPSPFNDAYEILRTQVMQRMQENGWKLLGITSPRAGEGKTLVSLNLAVSLAMDTSQTVLLVDADLRNPSIHRAFGLGEGLGLVDHLRNQTPLSDLLVHPGIQRLVLLPGGRPVVSSSDLMSAPAMRALVNDLKHRYTSRVVLFDLPPLLNAADVIAFAPLIDTFLLVVEAGRTQIQDVERSLNLLSGVPIIGTVFNKG